MGSNVSKNKIENIRKILFSNFCDLKSSTLFFKTLYHSAGKIYATSGSRLAIVKMAYDEQYEGKLLTREGTKEEGRVPQYGGAAPDESAFLESYTPERVEALQKALKKEVSKTETLIVLHSRGEWLLHVHKKHLNAAFLLFNALGEKPALKLCAGERYNLILLKSESVFVLLTAGSTDTKIQSRMPEDFYDFDLLW
jgi:hypothetical protein